ncbi:MAG: tetratricopeptide repeat protein [Bacteroidales bacterium]|jgi:tetratricopeptide (TPR) repeat protein|nr:tetratricopeptide repeat protein [Bacteroidales bacterium]
MKKILLTIVVALCTMGISAAQDLEKATELYNNAAAAIENSKAEAIDLFQQALDMAGKLGEEGQEIVNQCKGIIPKLYISLAKELVNEKKLDEAVAKFKEAIKIGKELGDDEVADEAKTLIPQIQLADANSLLNAKDYEGAVAAYQKVIDSDPENGAAHLRKGQALVALGKLDDAVKAFELASKNGEEDAAAKQLSNTYVKKAVACQKAKDMKGALENAQKSTQYVDNANAQKIIGISASSLKQNKVAAEAFEAYLSMSPDAKDKNQIIYQLATALVATGDNAKACGYFKQIAQDAKFGEAARYQITTLKCN